MCEAVNVRLIGSGSWLPVASLIGINGNVITGADVLNTLQIIKKKDPLNVWSILVKKISRSC
jgi:hypothetical protein